MAHSSRFQMMFAGILSVQMILSPIILGAQQSSSDVPVITIRANTRLVVVDVVVRLESHVPESWPSSTVTVIVAVPAEVQRKLTASDGPAASSEVAPSIPMVPPSEVA